MHWRALAIAEDAEELALSRFMRAGSVKSCKGLRRGGGMSNKTSSFGMFQLLKYLQHVHRWHRIISHRIPVDLDLVCFLFGRVEIERTI